MQITRRHTLGLLGSALAFPYILRSDPTLAAATVTKQGPATRIDVGALQANTVGSARLAAAGGGFMAGWVRSVSFFDSTGHIRYFNATGAPTTAPIILGGPAGPTDGNPISDVSPLLFADGSALGFFSADNSANSVVDATDAFAQRFSAAHAKVGVPRRVHQRPNNRQARIFSARLANGNALVLWVENSTTAASFDIWGRVINKSVVGVSDDRLLTVASNDRQTIGSIAALTNGTAVFSYVVTHETSSTISDRVLVQRVSAAGVRLGAPVAVKLTTGENNYGPAGVAALPGGKFIALYFKHVSGPAARATLFRRIFSATGVAGAEAAIGVTQVNPIGANTPKIAVQPGSLVSIDPQEKGRIVVTTSGAGATNSVQVWVLNAEGVKEAGPINLATNATALLGAASVIRLTNGNFVASYSQGAVGATPARSLFQRFRVT